MDSHSYPPSNTFQGERTYSPSNASSNGEDEIINSRYNHNGVSGSSTGSLPRYTSNQNGSSPLNPSSTTKTRYSVLNREGSAHPLSNSMYLESDPTLNESLQSKSKLSNSSRKQEQDDGLGNYILPNLDSSVNSSQEFKTSEIPTGLNRFYRNWSGASLGDSGQDERHVKLPHLGYLDGLKFLSAWVVLNGVFFGAVLPQGALPAIGRDSPLYILRSTNLGITFLLILLGRSLITPLWDVPNSPSSTPSKAAALISWPRLTRAMLIRPFRFILPVLVVVALQWGLGSSGATKNCNAVGMDEPYWSLISSFSGFSTLVYDLFTYFESDTIAGQTFGANLWTVPWFFQSSYAVYVIHLMLGNLSSNRYWVYGILCAFSWATYNYFFVAIMGMVLADMHAHGHLYRIRTKWSTWQRTSLQISLVVIACVTQFVPIIRNNINLGLAVLNVQNHPELTFADSIFAICILFFVEISGWSQRILGNIVMRWLAKTTAGLYLLAPAITFSIVPNLALTLKNNNTAASTVLGVTWIVLFLSALIFAAGFHFLVELPSKLFGEVVVELLESNGEDRRMGGGVKMGRKGNNVLGKTRPVLA